MAISAKQYVDYEGLAKFKELLVGKYTDGSYTVMTATNATNANVAKNYATSTGSASIEEALASKADSSVLTDEIGKLVSKVTTIAGVDLQNDITKEELLLALNVADGAQANVIEKVTIGGVEQAVDSDTKTVTLNLDAYAKKADITAVLKFKGVKTSLAELGDASDSSIGDVWIVTEGAEYAEYVCVDTNGEVEGGYKWEKLGIGVDLVGYYTSAEVDTKVTNAVNDAKTEVTSAYQTADTTLETKLQNNIDALYKVAEGADTGVIAGRLDAVETKATNNADAIATLEGDDTVVGSVANKIKDAIDALDSTSSTGTVNGGYVLSVVQTDGKVTVETASFSGDVSTASSNAVTGSAVSSYVTTQINSLSVENVGDAGSFISVVGETAGKINATSTAFAESVKDTTSVIDNVAPTEHAVRTAIDSAYELITAVPLTGEGSITSIFA